MFLAHCIFFAPKCKYIFFKQIGLWDAILWAWRSEPKRIFLGISSNVNGIFFDTWDKIFGDMEEYYAMCHGWTIFLDLKMDELL